uniref:hypothetical protein n=1 Tax=Thermomonas sp. TaxID=1971895 RepID=UPI003220005D
MHEAPHHLRFCDDPKAILRESKTKITRQGHGNLANRSTPAAGVERALATCRVHFVAGFRYGYSRATREFSAAFLQ